MLPLWRNDRLVAKSLMLSFVVFVAIGNTVRKALNRTGFVGGLIQREDGADATTQQVLARAASARRSNGGKSSPHPVRMTWLLPATACARDYAGCVVRRSSAYVMAPGRAMAAWSARRR